MSNLQYDNIPNELQSLRQWVCFKYEDRTDHNGEVRRTKIPINANGGARARSNDPATWNTFEVAVKAMRRYDGIGFILSQSDPYTLIDLDHCVDEQGIIKPSAMSTIRQVDSYSEFSPSNRGIHIFAQATKPGPRCRIHSHPDIEIYDNLRFVVVTGNHIPNTPPTIEPRANEIAELYNRLFGGREPKVTPEAEHRISTNTSPLNLSDWELVEKAKRAKKTGPAFTSLWYGNAHEYGNDLSAASLALCNHLAFWTQDDAKRMDQLFRDSGLMRDKWDSPRPEGTWGSKTIQKAISDPHQVYSGGNGTTGTTNGNGKSRLQQAIEAATITVDESEVQEIEELARVTVAAKVKAKTEQPDSSNPRVRVSSSVSLDYLDDLPPPRPLDDLIPPYSYLDSYVSYASELTDAPREFHLAAGLMAIAAAVGNRVWLHAWGNNIYPNLWIVILAPSGFYRKSTAISIGLKALRGCCEGAVLPDDFTREKLIECLQHQPYGVIPVYEFGDLLARLSRDYNAGLKEFLTLIFDGNMYERKTKRETLRIDDSAVSILAASTIDWIHDRITDGDVRGGFLARYMFWPSIEKNGWKGLEPSPDTTMLTEIQKHLGHIQDNLQGGFSFSQAVMDQYNNWVRAHEEEINNRQLPSEVQGFYTRLATYVLKLAMLYQISIDVNSNLTPRALEYAIRLAEHLKGHLIRLIQEDLTTTKDARDLKAIKDIITREPGISRSRILKNSHMIARRLDDLMATLMESGQVVVQMVQSSNKPKQTFYTSEHDGNE